jgi:hypothetical protein
MKNILGATLLLVAGTLGAEAATLSGDTTGEFTGSLDSFNVDDDGRIARWPFDNCGTFIGCTGQSTLTFVINGSDGDFDFSHTVTSSGSFRVGEIRWFNAASRLDSAWGFPGTDSAFTLLADMTIDYQSPTDLAPSTQGVSLAISNTVNPPGDIFSGAALKLGGLTYGQTLPLNLGSNLVLTGYSLFLKPNSNSTYDPVTGVWTLKEHKSATLEIRANVSVVPLPAAAWMLLAGIGGLAAVARRKKMAA